MDYLKRYPQIFISLICIACYLPFANIGFLSDDFTFLQHYQSEGWGMISSNFYDAFFIPVTHIIQLILLDVFNQNALLIHITQIILHFYIAVLIYRIALENLNFKPYSAILSSIFFILIPYQSEAIFWFSSIGYQCCLMLTLVAIRSYFKNQIVSYCLFFILSIHCKEIGYTTPIFIYALSYFTKQKKKNLYLLYSFLIVILSLISRYLVLGELVGGYGEITHLNFQLTSVLKVIGGYFIKFFSFSRYATSSGFLITQCLLIISILTPIIIHLIKNQKFNKVGLWLFIFSICILPVINLEITSINMIQSDRYGYFASVPIVLFFGSAVSFLKNKMKILVTAFSISMFFFMAILNNQKWIGASLLAENYLSELSKVLSNEKKVFLLNVPDNFNGVYVLRNGVRDYLSMKNIETEIYIWKFQSFKQLNGGIEFRDKILKEYNTDTYFEKYSSNLSDVISNCDLILYYNNFTFNKIDKFTFTIN